MALFEIINRAERIHRLIRNESTGNPCEFAERMALSRRQLYNLLDEFKDYGAEIRYCRNRQSFYYVNDFQLELIIRVTSVSEQDKMNIYGGKSENNLLGAIRVHGDAGYLLM